MDTTKKRSGAAKSQAPANGPKPGTSGTTALAPKQSAASSALSHHTLTLLLGPPGSGKSHFLVDTVYGESLRLLGADFDLSPGFLLPPAPLPAGLLPAVYLANHAKRPPKGTTVLSLAGLRAPLVHTFVEGGRGECPECQTPLTTSTYEGVKKEIDSCVERGGRSLLVGVMRPATKDSLAPLSLLQQGFSRVLLQGHLFDLQKLVENETPLQDALREANKRQPPEEQHPAAESSTATFALVIERVVSLPLPSPEEFFATLKREFPASVSSAPPGAALPISQVVTRGERLSDAVLAVTSYSCPLPLSEGPFCPACYHARFEQCSWCAGQGCSHCYSTGASPELLAFARSAPMPTSQTSTGQLQRFTLLQALSATPVALLALLKAEKKSSSLLLRSLQLSISEERLTRGLRLLVEAGLGNISLAQEVSTLSSGEFLKLRAALLLLNEATELLLLLDEPSRVLSPADLRQLYALCQHFVAAGNTVIIGEQEERALVAKGAVLRHLEPVPEDQTVLTDIAPPHLCPPPLTTLASLILTPDAPPLELAAWSSERSPRRTVTVTPLQIPLSHLGECHLSFPLNALVSLSGRSGSGKSVLLQALFRALSTAQARREWGLSAVHLSLNTGEGDRHTFFASGSGEGVAVRSPWQTVLEYLGGEEECAHLFASLPLARQRGLAPSDFLISAHEVWGHGGSGGGEDNRQDGAGLQMRAGGAARGFHFRSTLLEVEDRGITLQTVLTLSATEAGRFFARSPRLARALERLTSLGLSALPVGAFLWQLTHGQRQRLRLAALTAEPAGALYLIDDPLSGLTERERGEVLHFLTGVVESGATVLYSAHEAGEIKPKKVRKQR